jgi:hypothetical protein
VAFRAILDVFSGSDALEWETSQIERGVLFWPVPNDSIGLPAAGLRNYSRFFCTMNDFNEI